jgi:hypothetical protein
MLCLLTFTFSSAPTTGITRREGLFDDQNGLFLEDNGTNYGLVTRSYVTGSAVDTRVAQANWNKDKMDGTGVSGITLDFTKTQILWMDYEWLGVGRVRMGFVVDGMFYVAHEFLHTNALSEVYMSTPNLPLRSEIINDGNGEASSMTQICSTVSIEGGVDELGLLRSASTDGTHVDADTENTIYAVLGLKLKSNYIGAIIKILTLMLQKLQWILQD